MAVEVLIADDHKIIRKAVANVLGESSELLIAGEASNGSETLEKIREKEWGLLILDLSMPGRNGLELIKLIKAEQPRLPILIFSMHQEELYAVRAIRSGAMGYLTKDADSETLLSAALKVARHGVFVSPHVAELLALDISSQNSDSLHASLSNREYEIFIRIVRGLSVSDIANEFSLSIKTVSTHKAHILDKMGMNNTVDLVRYALDHKLIDA